jgi:hypothetical protein
MYQQKSSLIFCANWIQTSSVTSCVDSPISCRQKGPTPNEAALVLGEALKRARTSYRDAVRPTTIFRTIVRNL